MPTSEALIVTALGMTVVFIGLLLCIAFIVMFGRVAKHVTWGEGGHGHGHGAPAPAPASPAAHAEAIVSSTPSEPIPADIQAVIAAALEVERRLYLFRSGARLTIRRSNLPS